MSIHRSRGDLSVRTLEDMICLAPYLIGFHPEESLVVMVVVDGLVEVTARVDLDQLGDPGELDRLIARLFDTFPRGKAWCLAFTERTELAWQVLGQCSAAVGRPRLMRLIQVGDSRWWADGPGGAGRALKVTAAAAEAAVIGLPAWTSRAELAQIYAAPADDPSGELAGLFEAAATEVSELLQPARRQLLRRLRHADPGREDCVRLAVLLAEPAAVAAVLTELTRENADGEVHRWQAVVRNCLPPFLPGPLAVLGLAGWQTGNGAVLSICLERLEDLDPTSPLTAVLNQVNVAVLPPSSWPRWRAEVVALLEEWSALASREGRTAAAGF